MFIIKTRSKIVNDSHIENVSPKYLPCTMEHGNKYVISMYEVKDE